MSAEKKNLLRGIFNTNDYSELRKRAKIHAGLVLGQSGSFSIGLAAQLLTFPALDLRIYGIEVAAIILSGSLWAHYDEDSNIMNERHTKLAVGNMKAILQNEFHSDDVNILHGAFVTLYENAVEYKVPIRQLVHTLNNQAVSTDKIKNPTTDLEIVAYVVRSEWLSVHNIQSNSYDTINNATMALDMTLSLLEGASAKDVLEALNGGGESPTQPLWFEAGKVNKQTANTENSRLTDEHQVFLTSLSDIDGIEQLDNFKEES
ncbi:TPA: hypothetical protein DIV55_07235 [Patescibacteria group bacterium]|uniref:Uncharacterized protein n=1 Tax=Candidatus Gottesmanbacteria bacterium GW2011_GWA1_43_11 TaxID=1618436 RepID=A0A0G1FD46_9BACT|nr:MAG: hypothetical protein UV59_C0014G0026 [Candidatus Gottesmanbacteria bacterium GW2011_GWA1_43_11]HCS79495.1 hypothetical protein [Patescibacteria group bacterium]